MQERTSLRLVHPGPDSIPADRATKPLTMEEKHEVFKGLVVASLDAGFLRYSRRQELLKIAARLGLGEFEACLLIAEAQFQSGDIDPIASDEFAHFQESPVPAGLSVWMRIGLAMAVAAIFDVVLLGWLL